MQNNQNVKVASASKRFHFTPNCQIYLTFRVIIIIVIAGLTFMCAEKKVLFEDWLHLFLFSYKFCIIKKKREFF